MKNYVIVALTDSPQGPQITQEGQLVFQVGDFFVVDFFRPASHTRMLNVSELRPFHLFSSHEQFVAFLNKIQPPAPLTNEPPAPVPVVEAAPFPAVVEDVVPGTNTPSA